MTYSSKMASVQLFRAFLLTSPHVVRVAFLSPVFAIVVVVIVCFYRMRTLEKVIIALSISTSAHSHSIDLTYCIGKFPFLRLFSSLHISLEKLETYRVCK